MEPSFRCCGKLSTGVTVPKLTHDLDEGLDVIRINRWTPGSQKFVNDGISA